MKGLQLFEQPCTSKRGARQWRTRPARHLSERSDYIVASFEALEYFTLS